MLDMGERKEFPGEWPFDDPPNVAVFTTTHVVRAGQPILYVSHDAADGAWQFHSADAFSEDDAMVVALAEIVELDPSIIGLAQLPLGWRATRTSRASAWKLAAETE
jgi:hypothetical protein